MTNHLIDTEEKWEWLFDEVKESSRRGLRMYFETLPESYEGKPDTLTSFSVAWESSETPQAAYVPLAHFHKENCPISLDAVEDFLLGHSFLVCDDFVRLQHLYALLGCDPCDPLEYPDESMEDLRVTASCLGIAVKSFRNLANLTMAATTSDIEKLVRDSGSTMGDTSAKDQDLIDLCCKDARIVLDLSKYCYTQPNLFRHFLFPLYRDLLRASVKGYAVEWDALDFDIMDTEHILGRLEEGVFSFLPKPINLNSSKQVASALFTPQEEGGLGLEPKTFTPKGSPSVSKEALQTIKDQAPIIPSLLEYKEEKARLNALNKFSENVLVHDHGAYMYPEWIVGYGEIRSRNPSLFRIPRDILDFLLPDGPDRIWFSLDDLHLELAYLAGEEPALVEALATEDVWESLGISPAHFYQVFCSYPKVDSEHEEVTLQVVQKLPKLFQFLDKTLSEESESLEEGDTVGKSFLRTAKIFSYEYLKQCVQQPPEESYTRKKSEVLPIEKPLFFEKGCAFQIRRGLEDTVRKNCQKIFSDLYEIGESVDLAKVVRITAADRILEHL